MADVIAAPEVTVESLQAQLATEQTAHQVTKDALATALENHADAAGALMEAGTVIDGQKATIQTLEAQVIALQTSPAEFPTITVNKKSYEVRVKSFQYKKQEYSLEQLLTDKALQKELVEKGVGFLVLTEA